jgi:hypothetical protein
MLRGKLHRLRMASEKEAAAVRSMFEMYDSGKFGRKGIARSLEERRTPTRMGRRHWYRAYIKSILQKTAYAGVQYFNTQTKVKSEADPTISRKHSHFTRPRAEWIAVKVPAIVSQDLFDRVQSRLQHVAKRDHQPDTHYLLSGLVSCGECGRAFSSYRRHLTVQLGGKEFAVRLQVCAWRHSEGAHDRSKSSAAATPKASEIDDRAMLCLFLPFSR